MNEYNSYCAHRDIITNPEGFEVCAGCGLITNNYPQLIYNFPYENKPSKERPLEPLKGLRGAEVLGSIIADRRDALGYTLESNETVGAIFRTWQIQKSMVNMDKLYTYSTILNEIAQEFNLLYVIRNDAFLRFKKLVKTTFVLNKVVALAYCVWESIQAHKYPISTPQLIDAFQRRGHNLHGRLLFQAALKYRPHLRSLGFSVGVQKTAFDYVGAFVAAVMDHPAIAGRKEKKAIGDVISYKYRLQQRACELLHRKSNGSRPAHAAAAAIYFTGYTLAQETDHKSLLTQRIVSEATGVKEYTIRDVTIKLFGYVQEKRIREASKH